MQPFGSLVRTIYFVVVTGDAIGLAISKLFNELAGDQLYFIPPATLNWLSALLLQSISFDLETLIGVTVVNEQTAYQTPGNSHTARQTAAELQCTELTGDSSYQENAIRALSWATYMVDTDVKNRYPQDENWLTDGYGDYVRHYLRAFAAIPSLAPSDEDHILSSTAIIQYAAYKTVPTKNLFFGAQPKGVVLLKYSSSDVKGQEVIRLGSKPASILFNNKVGNEIGCDVLQNMEGYHWQPLPNGGLLYVHRLKANEIMLME